jgi:xylulose-5-phosphate/fructose-6-phosphate phosphoketolase
VKPRLLGHWRTTPGLNFIYAHANRVIKARDLNAIYVIGPGHGGPGIVANAYLEGTYSEVYPSISCGVDGMRRLIRQFSFPGGIPSHVAPETPGSIHEGGELGYALAHAYGAAFDNADLLVVCVVGDGEAETGPLAASWHSNKFLNSARDGAVLPILHLNGYKIANPTILARIPEEELRSLLEGYGYDPVFVTGEEPEQMHQLMAAALDRVLDQIADIQSGARRKGIAERPRWPMMVLRTPKGWTGPKEVDGLPVEDSFPSHQVPVADLAKQPEHLRVLEEWMHSYRPEELFDEGGAMEVLSEHLCQGWLEGYLLTGRHGLFNCYEAFIHIVDSMLNQHAKWLKTTRAIPWRRPIPSLNYLLTSLVWRQDQTASHTRTPASSTTS